VEGETDPARPPPRAPAIGTTHLCVPKMSSMSCDLRVFMEDAAEAVMALDLELI
jgi:hypothetical protein